MIPPWWRPRQKLPLISQQRFWHPKTDPERGVEDWGETWWNGKSFFSLEGLNGNIYINQWEWLRILKWRYVRTKVLAIFCGDINILLHRPDTYAAKYMVSTSNFFASARPLNKSKSKLAKWGFHHQTSWLKRPDWGAHWETPLGQPRAIQNQPMVVGLRAQPWIVEILSTGTAGYADTLISSGDVKIVINNLTIFLMDFPIKNGGSFHILCWIDRVFAKASGRLCEKSWSHQYPAQKRCFSRV